MSLFKNIDFKNKNDSKGYRRTTAIPECFTIIKENNFAIQSLISWQEKAGEYETTEEFFHSDLSEVNSEISNLIDRLSCLNSTLIFSIEQDWADLYQFKKDSLKTAKEEGGSL